MANSLIETSYYDHYHGHSQLFPLIYGLLLFWIHAAGLRDNRDLQHVRQADRLVTEQHELVSQSDRVFAHRVCALVSSGLRWAKSFICANSETSMLASTSS